MQRQERPTSPHLVQQRWGYYITAEGTSGPDKTRSDNCTGPAEREARHIADCAREAWLSAERYWIELQAQEGRKRKRERDEYVNLTCDEELNPDDQEVDFCGHPD